MAATRGAATLGHRSGLLVVTVNEQVVIDSSYVYLTTCAVLEEIRPTASQGGARSGLSGTRGGVTLPTGLLIMLRQ